MSGMILLSAIGFGLLGYLSGSLPFAVWMTRLVRGVDVRDSGSGHATATNTLRQFGLGLGAVVAVLDVTKGFVPTWLAVHYAPGAWIVPLTAALAVVGHCWPLFAGFRGGMGLSAGGGALLSVSPRGIVLALGLLVALTLGLRHSARASVLMGLLIAPWLWLFGLRDQVIWIAVAAGLVIAYRFLLDWHRQYRELWLDRDMSKGGDH
jgi:glycerol-3-phosphate acyltransferase PlsY